MHDKTLCFHRICLTDLDILRSHISIKVSVLGEPYLLDLYSSTQLPGLGERRLWYRLHLCINCSIVLFFVPESPRWLIRKDRNEEALEILAIANAGGDEKGPLGLSPRFRSLGCLDHETHID